MIKVINNSTTIQHALNVDGTPRNLVKNGGFHYYDDNFISEIEKATEVIPALQMINFAGPITQRDDIDIVGKGQGANKTTTGLYGVTTTEDFGIGDELFIHWSFHSLIKRDVSPILKFGFTPVTSEVGKLVSAEISILSGNGAGAINDAPVVYNLTDLIVPPTAFVSGDVELIVPISHIASEFSDLSLKLKRIAATSDDLIGDVALHHVFCDYDRYLV